MYDDIRSTEWCHVMPYHVMQESGYLEEKEVVRVGDGGDALAGAVQSHHLEEMQEQCQVIHS